MPSQTHNLTQNKPATTPKQRFLAIGFLILAILILAGVIFLATGQSRVAFTWIPQTSEAKTTLTAAVTPVGTDLPAVFLEKNVEVEKTFEAQAETAGETPAETPTFQGKARGNVKIINSYSKTQPLQAGTRFQSPDGLIFRTQARVDVPAGSSVTTLIIADEAGEKGALAKNTRFTIPGLWLGLQDKIYGVAAENFYGETSQTSSGTSGLTANELANAEAELKQTAIAQAEPELQKLVPEGKKLLPGMIYAQTTARSGPKIGEQKSNYTLKLTVKTVGVAVAETELRKAAEELLNSTLTQELQLLTLNTQDFLFKVSAYDATKAKAEFELMAKGKTAPAPSHALFQPSTYVGKNQAEIEKLLTQNPAISNIAVEITPFWVKKVPSDAKKLRLEIQRGE
ncbi:hypothetical protein C4546_02200 [Candidatus Parcubacteria bacterium]|jgi:hypothetical protein|nr:MAG: hypothetical protein C4546_02200 [Candidatus Parcubacteria bacterium]